MINLFINNYKLDLADDFEYKISRSLSEFKDLNARKGDISYTIDLPRNNNNQYIVNLIDFKQLNTARLIDNGIEIISGSVDLLNETAKDKIKIRIKGLNSNINKILDEIQIRDLDLGSVIFSDANIILGETKDDSRIYATPIINMGDWDVSGEVNRQDRVVCIRLIDTVIAAINEAGYQLESDLFDLSIDTIKDHFLFDPSSFDLTNPATSLTATVVQTNLDYTERIWSYRKVTYKYDEIIPYFSADPDWDTDSYIPPIQAFYRILADINLRLLGAYNNSNVISNLEVQLIQENSGIIQKKPLFFVNDNPDKEVQSIIDTGKILLNEQEKVQIRIVGDLIRNTPLTLTDANIYTTSKIKAIQNGSNLRLVITTNATITSYNNKSLLGFQYTYVDLGTEKYYLNEKVNYIDFSYGTGVGTTQITIFCGWFSDLTDKMIVNQEYDLIGYIYFAFNNQLSSSSGNALLTFENATNNSIILTNPYYVRVVNFHLFIDKNKTGIDSEWYKVQSVTSTTVTLEASYDELNQRFLYDQDSNNRLMIDTYNSGWIIEYQLRQENGSTFQNISQRGLDATNEVPLASFLPNWTGLQLLQAIKQLYNLYFFENKNTRTYIINSEDGFYYNEASNTVNRLAENIFPVISELDSGQTRKIEFAFQKDSNDNYVNAILGEKNLDSFLLELENQNLKNEISYNINPYISPTILRNNTNIGFTTTKIPTLIQDISTNEWTNEFSPRILKFNGVVATQGAETWNDKVSVLPTRTDFPQAVNIGWNELYTNFYINQINRFNTSYELICYIYIKKTEIAALELLRYRMLIQSNGYKYYKYNGYYIINSIEFVNKNISKFVLIKDNNAQISYSDENFPPNFQGYVLGDGRKQAILFGNNTLIKIIR